MTTPLRSEQSTANAWRWAIAALVVATFLMGAAWSLMTAPFSTVDEGRHLNSVVRLMEGGGWPGPREAPMLDAVRTAAAEAGNALPGDVATPRPPGERSTLDSASGSTRGVDGDPDWMTQHPPGFYALTAGILKVIGAHGWSWDHALFAMRMLSNLWVALAAIPVVLAARRLTGSARGALVGAAAVLAVPQYFHVGALVTNDSLSVLLASLILYLCVKLMDSPRAGWTLPLAVGLTLGLALFTKGLFLTLIPVVAIAVVVPAAREYGPRWRALVAPAVTMGVAFVVGGWWYLRNLLVFGALQPSNFGSGRNPEPVDGYDLAEFLVRWAATLNQTFWGSLNPSLDLPRWFDVAAFAAAAAALVGGFLVSRRKWILVVLSIYPVALVAITLQHSWEIYWNTGAYRGIQGRYLFSAVLVMAALLAQAWVFATSRLRDGVQRALAAAVVLGFGAVGAYGWLFALQRLWPESAGVNDAVVSMGEALGIPGAAATGIVIATAVAVVALAVAAASRFARRFEAQVP